MARKRPKKTKLRGRDQSIDAEPTTAAMRGDLDPRKDSSEPRANLRIDNEHLAESFEAEAERSVFDEPTFSTELAGAVPENALTYERFLADQLEETNALQSWFVTGVLAGSSGILAILGSLISESANLGLASSVQFFAIAVFAPVIEEVMKTAVLLWGVEQKPYFFRSPKQLMIIGAISGLVFASVENVLYLTVYIDHPSRFIIVWRWTACVGLHTTTTMIATIGLVKIWERVMRTGQFARAEIGAKYLLIAIIIHGLYNAAVYMVGITGAF